MGTHMDIVSRNIGGGREVVYGGNQVCLLLADCLCTPLSRTMQAEKKQNEPPREMFYRGLQNEIMRLLFWTQTKGVLPLSLSPILPANLLSYSVRSLEIIILES